MFLNGTSWSGGVGWWSKSCQMCMRIFNINSVFLQTSSISTHTIRTHFIISHMWFSQAQAIYREWRHCASSLMLSRCSFFRFGFPYTAISTACEHCEEYVHVTERRWVSHCSGRTRIGVNTALRTHNTQLIRQSHHNILYTSPSLRGIHKIKL